MPNDRCLVLGASGFVGIHLSEALADARIPVRAFSRTIPKNSAAHIEWHAGDFHNPADVRSALIGCDTVYHLISTTTPGTSNQSPSRDIRENVLGTVQLLDLMRDEGVRKIVFVSTGGAIYGNNANSPLSESAATDPISAYGIGKLTIEKYLALYERIAGISYRILRVANVFGEGQPVNRSQGAVGIFLAKALRGEIIEIWGDGSAVRDYVYVGDVVRALRLAADYDGPGRLFNVGSGRGRSLNELLAGLEAELGTRIQRRHYPVRSGDVATNFLDITRARRLLGWEPQVEFSEALRRVVSSMRREFLSGDQSTVLCAA